MRLFREYTDSHPEWWKLFKKLFWISLLVHVVTAWFSEGFHRPDEHLGIMRWMGHKLGIQPESILSWEWPAQIRPWLQPGIYYLISKTLNTFGIENPFTISFVLRLFSSMTGLLAVCGLAFSFSRILETNKWKNFSLYGVFFLWYLPFFHARTTSENLSINFFCYAFTLVTMLTPLPLLRNKFSHPELPLDIEKNRWGISIFMAIGVGLLLSASFVFRYQSAVMIFTFCLWYLTLGKMRINTLFWITFSFFMGLGISAIINYWGYGEWTFPPYNNYYQNMVKGMAAGFGVDPWWKYITKTITRGIPPLSFLFLIPIVWMTFKRPKHLVLWIVLPFFVFHSAIAHKELRFIFGLGLFAPFYASYFFESMGQKIVLPQWLWKLMIFQNMALLLFNCFRPAYSPIKFYKHLYYKKEKVEAITTLNLIRDQMHYYQKNPIQLTYREKIDDVIAGIGTEKRWILTDQQKHIARFRELSYCREDYLSYPNWVLNLLNKFSKRSKVWGLYACQKYDTN